MRAIALCLLLHLLGFAGSLTVVAAEVERFDLLVFAPHPDDEALGCAGVMSQALEAQRTVGVVVLTNGGGFPKAAAVVTNKEEGKLVAADFLKLAAERQQQSLLGMRHVGVPAENVLFLGYPDSGLKAMYSAAKDTVYRQPFTEKSATYGPAVPDYHSEVHDGSAAYTKASVIEDIAEIIASRRPSEIYVTHEVDTHSDHKAAFWFVRDAARAAQFRGAFFTYVNHGTVQPELPIRRVPLTAAQLAKKRLAIRAHQIPVVHEHLQSYAKPAETFWKVPVE